MRARESAAPVASAVPRASNRPIRASWHLDAWWTVWSALTLSIAGFVVLVDAVLLQQRRSFFTGGFLAVDHAAGPLQGAMFLLVALVIDACLIGAIVAIGLWAGAAIRLNRSAACAAAGGLALLPIGFTNLIEYQVLTHLGDLFDAGLMFDLAGRSPSEVLAVSWPQVLRFGGVSAGIVAVAAGVVWALRRRPGAVLTGVGAGRTCALAAALVLGGAGITLAARGSSDVFDNGLRRTPAGRFLGAIVNLASDVDRDGYGLLGRPPDSALFDAGVHPYAIEIPGNGVDENGVGGDLPGDLPPYVERWTGEAPWQMTPDVVLIVLESFRADVLDAVVDGRPVTPELADLASRGVSSRLAYSHNGYTVQSRRHIFSGSAADIDRGTTIVDDFKAKGYETAYFSAQDESFGGPDQGVGFDRADTAYDARVDADRRYSTFTTAGSLAVSHAVLQERVGAFLEARRSDRPLFLYVNFHDTHFPYHHGEVQPLVGETVLRQAEISPSRAGELRAMYLNTAANVDRAIGELIATATHTLGRVPGVIVLADHGESLFDEGFLGHGYALNDAQTRIPLIVAGLPLTIREPFGQADLRALIHDALSAPAGTVSGPRLIEDDSKVVFQYLGTLDRPRAIGATGAGGQLVYDMRSGRTSIDGAWKSDSELSEPERRRTLDLIHLWERMAIARHAQGSGLRDQGSGLGQESQESGVRVRSQESSSFFLLSPIF